MICKVRVYDKKIGTIRTLRYNLKTLRDIYDIISDRFAIIEEPYTEPGNSYKWGMGCSRDNYRKDGSK